MFKTACFDLEVAFLEPDQFELVQSEELTNLWDLWPFSISVAAIKLSDHAEPEVWYDTFIPNGMGQEEWPWSMVVEPEIAPYWSEKFTRRFVQRLEELDRLGYTLVSWNGAGFDFQLLYKLTKDPVLKALCWRHIDPCFQMLAMKGFMVGLEAAALEAGARSKEEDGGGAPLMWAEGDYARVITYVKGDVLRTEAVIKGIFANRGLQWVTKKGGISFQPFDYGILKLIDCIKIPIPNTKWMKKTDMTRPPLTRESVLSWMQEEGDAV